MAKGIDKRLIIAIIVIALIALAAYVASTAFLFESPVPLKLLLEQSKACGAYLCGSVPEAASNVTAVCMEMGKCTSAATEAELKEFCGCPAP